MFLFQKIPPYFTSLVFFISLCIASHLLAFKIVHIPVQLEMVILFSAVIFYPVLRFPRIGVYLLFIIMPLIPFFRRLYYLQYNRPSADPLIAVGDILISFIMAGLYFEFRKRKDVHEDNLKLDSWIMIYFVYLIIRVFFMNALPLPEAIMRFRFYGPAVLLFFVGTIFSKDIKMLKNIWIITTISAIAAALYGIKQLTLGYTEFEKLWFSSISFTTLFIKGVARPFSFFQSPAAFADYMLLAMIGIIIITTGSKKFSTKYYLLLLIPLFVYALLITSVRSNWIGAIVIVFFWLFITKFNSWRIRFSAIIGLILIFVIFQLFDSYFKNAGELQHITSVVSGQSNREYFDLLVKQRVSALSNPFDEHSLLSRVALWKYLLSCTSDPVMAILGRGVGGLSADSLYFTYLAEFGFPGMIFIVFISIIMVVKGFNVLDSSDDPSVIALARGITIMNIVFGIVNITGTHIHGFPGDLYFWFWNGVLLHIDPALKNRPPEHIQ